MRKTPARIGALLAAGLAAPAFAQPSVTADQGVYQPGTFSLDNAQFIEAVVTPAGGPKLNSSSPKPGVGVAKQNGARSTQNISHANTKMKQPNIGTCKSSVVRGPAVKAKQTRHSTLCYQMTPSGPAWVVQDANTPSS